MSYATTEYHSAHWMFMVESGWVTMWVDDSRIAHMWKDRQSRRWL